MLFGLNFVCLMYVIVKWNVLCCLSILMRFGMGICWMCGWVSVMVIGCMVFMCWRKVIVLILISCCWIFMLSRLWVN